jgi:hypothetical protein
VHEPWLDGVGSEGDHTLEFISTPETVEIPDDPTIGTRDDLFSGAHTPVPECIGSRIYDWTSPGFPIGFQNVTVAEGLGAVPVVPDDDIQETLPDLDPDIRSIHLAPPINNGRHLIHHVVPDSIWHLVAIFLDELHASMPVFKRSYLVDNLRERRNIHDRSFNALVHAISALVIFQMLQNSSGRRRKQFKSDQADNLLAEAVRLHSIADFGEAPVLENVLTSIFLFGCQFCKGNHHAARYRLSEAVTQAETMGLGDSRNYTNVARDERERRLRTFLCLTVIHRYVQMLTHFHKVPIDKANISCQRLCHTEGLSNKRLSSRRSTLGHGSRHGKAGVSQYGCT